MRYTYSKVREVIMDATPGDGGRTSTAHSGLVVHLLFVAVQGHVIARVRCRYRGSFEDFSYRHRFHF